MSRSNDPNVPKLSKKKEENFISVLLIHVLVNLGSLLVGRLFRILLILLILLILQEAIYRISMGPTNNEMDSSLSWSSGANFRCKKQWCTGVEINLG